MKLLLILLPRFDVEYTASTENGDVVISIVTNRRIVTTQQLGNLRGLMSCFHKRLNLITFSLAKMFVAHKVTLTGWSKKVEMLVHSQPTHLINQSCTSYLKPPIVLALLVSENIF